ncbi:MAG: hypothetical protein ACK5OX_09750 [Desertimonas sp.]
MAPARVIGDEGQLRRVVRNLLGGAGFVVTLPTASAVDDGL